MTNGAIESLRQFIVLSPWTEAGYPQNEFEKAFNSLSIQ
ncbi:hypothetical protein KOR42_50930 [Thalassoglobus neptunius]|uniref:Uncharacterized protein n=1 Tax=Thalassoglobus neptunius TaxID=1938619 RepID=A0A5C5VP43_9PLAN|nr:hypothetical protein KOR42_50930 [Thalassoglobus neptunius]